MVRSATNTIVLINVVSKYRNVYPILNMEIGPIIDRLGVYGNSCPNRVLAMLQVFIGFANEK